MNKREGYKLSKNDEKVVNAILDIYEVKKRENNNAVPEGSLWVSTREIAEACDINIYRARYSLLKLKTNGGVIQESTRHKTHGWRPTGILQR